MPQYSNTTTSAESGVIVNAVLDSVTNTITWTATAPNGAVASTVQSANVRYNTTVPGGSTLLVLSQQLRAQGVQRAALTFALDEAQDSVERQRTTATAEAAATNTPVPAAPNPPPPVSSTTDSAVPAPAQVPAPAVSAPAEVATDDPFEARRLEIEQEFNDPPPTLTADDVGEEDPFEARRLELEQEFNDPPPTLTAEDVGEEDPFEARRLELEQEFNDPPPTLTAEDVGEEDPFEARRLELEQEQNREELAASNFDPEPVGEEDPFEARRLEREREFDDPPPTFEPTPVDPNTDPVERARVNALIDEMSPVISEDEEAESNAQTKALLKQAQEQASIQQYFNQTTKSDWRVRLRIAPDADYLYQDRNNALLAPLRVSDGVVFPYTPIINTSYAAKYDSYDLTHSNYRGYFYRGSQVSDVQIQATFTAQDTREAQYVLAVIQFFRSATKMFYGKDQQRGSPPPLVYLHGYGEYQFNDHACVISNFQYNLPNDVDYIAVTPNNIGLNMSNRNNQVGSSPVSTISDAINRLSNLYNAVTGQPGVPKGASPGDRGDLGLTRQTVSGTGQTTYVPTKIDMTITLMPIQTRSQVSKQFSVKEFANGNLLKGGFW